jgi:uncharacterized protein YndB with AHSA1/START domain
MKAQKSIHIEAAPEKIWPYLVEPEKVTRWCITYKKFEYTGDVRTGVGAPLYIEEQGPAGLMKMKFEITDWKENEQLGLKMISGDTLKSYVQHLRLEPIPDGTRFTFAEEIELPYGVLGKLIGLVGERSSAATLDKMLAKLKALVED